jgi:hypothetical protein
MLAGERGPGIDGETLFDGVFVNLVDKIQQLNPEGVLGVFD